MASEAPADLIPCDLCGSTDAVELPQAKTFGSGGVFVCQGCGFVHVKKRRSFEEIAAAWDEIYGEGYTAMWPAVFARLNYVTEWFDQEYGWEGKSVLEIGAGEGRFLEMVRERGAYPVAIEPSAKNCATLRAKDIFAHHGTAEQCGQVGTFDVVAILWTLENTADCARMLAEAHKNLSQGGHLLVATGSRILTGYRKPLSTYFSQNPPDTHCFRWSAKTLPLAAHKAGFNLAKMNAVHECDWMVAVFDKNVAAEPPTGDDWKDVVAHFALWEKFYA